MKRKFYLYGGIISLVLGAVAFICFFVTGDALFYSFDEVTQIDGAKITTSVEYDASGNFALLMLIVSLISFVIGCLMLLVNRGIAFIKINIIIYLAIMGFILMFVGYILLIFGLEEDWIYIPILMGELVGLVFVELLLYLIKIRNVIIFENNFIKNIILFKEDNKVISKIPVSIILMSLYLIFGSLVFSADLILFIKRVI